MECPACGYSPAPGEGDGTQCPDCQVFYHKVLARQLRELQSKQKAELAPAPPPVRPVTSYAAPAVKESRSFTGSFLRAMLALIVISVVAVACLSDDRDKSTSRDYCNDAHMAQIMSRHFLKPRLVAPATAEFPSYNDPGVSVTTHGDCTFTVHSYVDAQNGFGALVRKRYTIEMKYLKDTNKWHGSDIEIF